MMFKGRSAAVSTACCCLGIGAALAQNATSPAPAAEDNDPGFFTGIMRRDSLLGDMGGLRTSLERYGVTLKLTDVSEILGNVSGGLQRGATYDALTTLTVQLDSLKAFGWDGGTFNVSALQIRGRGLSQFYVGNLQTVRGIAATPTTRLWEVWYQQTLANGKADIKIGQQSLDQEFMVSDGSALYLNTMMGWPMLPSANMFAGGPAYPLSSLGVRGKAHVASNVTVLGGVFQDNPPGGPFNDDGQLRGSTRWGGNFNLRTGALFIGEVQYALNHPAEGETDHGDRPMGLPGTYRLGVWYDTAGFPNQRYDTTGLSLANPASTGMPRTITGNFSLYGVIDQTVWRADPSGPRSLAVFVRAMGSPGDRNLVSFSVNGGVNLKAPLPGRDDDTFGIGFGVAQVSAGASGLDRDRAVFGGTASPIRSTETFYEVTYQAQVTPWLQVQPDFQYFQRTGGGIPSPTNPERRLRDAVVAGVRTNINF